MFITYNIQYSLFKYSTQYYGRAQPSNHTLPLPQLINWLLYKYLFLHNFYLSIVFQHFFKFVGWATVYILHMLHIHYATHYTKYHKAYFRHL